MKHALISVFLVALLLLIPVGFIGASSASAAPAASSAETCVLTYAVKEGNAITIVVCDQSFQFNVNDAANGTLGEVTLPPVPPVTVSGPTITVPGDPVTIKLPGTTQTVTLPGATQTAPGPTKTVTQPGSQITVTSDPEPVPDKTVTVTKSPEPSVTTVTATPRQDGTTPATIDPEPEEDGLITIPETKLDTPEVIGLGTLTILVLAALILLGMYAGYYLGYKDSDKAEAKFLHALLGK